MAKKGATTVTKKRKGEETSRGGVHKSSGGEKKRKLSPGAQLRLAMFKPDDAESEHGYDEATSKIEGEARPVSMVSSDVRESSVSAASVHTDTATSSAAAESRADEAVGDAVSIDVSDSFPFWNSEGLATPGDTVDGLVEIELPDRALVRAMPSPDPKFLPSLPFKMHHRSWGHFLLYKSEWEDENKVRTFVKYSNNVVRRNKSQEAKMSAYEQKLLDYRRACQEAEAAGTSVKSFRRPKRPEIIPAYCVVWNRTFWCTHGGKRASRGSGARTLKSTRSTDCPFKFVAEVQDWNGFWVVAVKSGSFFHNHPVSQLVYDGYSQNRVLEPDADLRHDLNMMIQGQGKSTEMFDYLLDNYKKPFKMKDIHNYIAEFKKERDGDLPENVRIADFLVRWHEEVDGNAVSVSTSASGVTASISLTSRFMRQLTTRFPEVLMIDCTHGVTSNHYQLCSLMVMDESGLGQFVQHSLLETNSIWHLEQVIQHFKDTNPCWTEVRVVVVDKDFKEIDVIKRLLPHVRVILCTFHVPKYLKNEIRKEKYGRRSSDQLAELYDLIYKMVYVTEEGEFHKLVTSFKNAVASYDGPEAKKDLWSYFEANWVGCSDMWASFARQDLPHLSNNTNNRLESIFGKLKDEMPDHQTSSECLKYLRKRARRDAQKYLTRTSFVGTMTHFSFDDEMSAVLRCCTPWVAYHIKKEYDAAVQHQPRYLISDVSDSRALVHLRSSCEVDKTTWIGTCGFAATMKLPCRHIIVYRLAAGLTPKVPTFAMNRRWSVEAPHLDDPLDSSIVSYRHTKQAPSTVSSLTKNQRFRLVNPILTQISDELVSLGTSRIRQEAQRLQLYLQSLRDGQPVIPDATPIELTKTSDDAVDDHSLDGDYSLEDDLVDAFVEAVIGDTPVSTSCELPVVVASDGEPEEDQSADDGVEVKKEMVHSHTPEETEENQSADEEAEIKKEKVHSETSVSQSMEADVEVKKEDTSEQYSINMRKAAPKVGRPSRGQLNLRPKPKAAAWKEGSKTLVQVLEAVADATDLTSIMAELAKIPVKDVAVSKIHARSPSKRAQFVAHAREAPLSHVVPMKLVTVCKAVILEKEAEAGAVTVDSDEATRTSGVNVPGVGVYSRAQVFAMQDYFLAHDEVSAGLDAVKWLQAFNTPTYNAVAERLQTLRPDAVVPRCELSDIRIRALYRVRHKLWFGEDLIHAFGIDLQHRYANCTVIMGAKLSWTNQVRHLSKNVIQNAVIYSTPYALIPVFIGDNHWACVAIDRARRLVISYDSLGKPRAKTMLKTAVTELCASLSDESSSTSFTMETRNTPVQEDEDNCGLFVCLFMQHVVGTVPEFAYQPEQLSVQRAEVLRKILDM